MDRETFLLVADGLRRISRKLDEKLVASEAPAKKQPMEYFAEAAKTIEERDNEDGFQTLVDDLKKHAQVKDDGMRLKSITYNYVMEQPNGVEIQTSYTVNLNPEQRAQFESVIATGKTLDYHYRGCVK